MTQADALVFPIGQYGGSTGPPGDPATRYDIRVGDRPCSLDAGRFLIWLSAHGTPGTRRWTARALTESLAAAGAAPAPDELDALYADGLLARVDPRQAVSFAAGHQLTPLVLGLGEDGDEPGAYPLGLLEQPLVAVAGPLFLLWAWSAVEDDLWSACRRLADDVGTGPDVVDDPALTDPEEVLAGMLEGVHGLLSCGAAYLDRVPS
ncbi:hypothetical protein ACWENR_10755 [Micromonospora sp. NPDC004336]